MNPSRSRSRSREQGWRIGETVAVAAARTCLGFVLPIFELCISTVADRLGRLMQLWRCISTGARLAADSVSCRCRQQQGRAGLKMYLAACVKAKPATFLNHQPTWQLIFQQWSCGALPAAGHSRSSDIVLITEQNSRN